MPTEQHLIEQAKTDINAFGQLYDQNYAKIASYILRRVGDVVVAQELTSNVFFKALHQIHRFEWRGLPFSAWLYRIAANEIASYFRSQHHHPLSLDELHEVHQFEPSHGFTLEQERILAEEQSEAYHDFRLVRSLLCQLPLKQQEVLALRYFEKQPLASIAAITNTNLNTVKSLLSRGTARLKLLYTQAKARPAPQPSATHRVIKAEE